MQKPILRVISFNNCKLYLLSNVERGRVRENVFAHHAYNRKKISLIDR